MVVGRRGNVYSLASPAALLLGWEQHAAPTSKCAPTAALFKLQQLYPYHSRPWRGKSAQRPAYYLRPSSAFRMVLISAATKAGSSFWIKWPHFGAIFNDPLALVRRVRPSLYEAQAGFIYRFVTALGTDIGPCHTQTCQHSILQCPARDLRARLALRRFRNHGRLRPTTAAFLPAHLGGQGHQPVGAILRDSSGPAALYWAPSDGKTGGI